MNIAVLLLAVVSFQADQLGKSDAEIIKMGRQAWGAFHDEKAGTSTADMCESELVYGAVLKRRNDRQLLKASRTTRSDVSQLRSLMRSFSESTYDVGTALSGGGTMWNIVYAGISADIEEVVGHTLGFKSPKVKSCRTSDVAKALLRLKNQVEQERKSIEDMPSGGGMKAANEGLAGANKAWKGLAKIAARQPRGNSDAVLSYCLASVADVWEFMGEGN